MTLQTTRSAYTFDVHVVHSSVIIIHVRTRMYSHSVFEANIGDQLHTGVCAQFTCCPPQATESTGATGGGEYSALQHGQGGRDKGRGKQPSTSKLVR